MKRNEPCINTTAKLWISHLLIYYFVFVSLSNFATKSFFFSTESLKMLLASPLLGLMGILDHFPLFFIFPIILMLIFYYKIFKPKIYRSYVVSLLISHFTLYLLLWSKNEHKHYYPIRRFIELQDQYINFLFFVIPSLALTLSINWFLFGRYENKKEIKDKVDINGYLKEKYKKK